MEALRRRGRAAGAVLVRGPAGGAAPAHGRRREPQGGHQQPGAVLRAEAEAGHQSRRTPPPHSAAAARRLVLKGARQHVLLAGQLEAHGPQAPHALAQERLHLGPGVPVARALGADHPVPLGVEEVGLVRELQDGAARIERGLNLLPDPLRHLLLREVRRVPRGPAQLIHRQPVPALVARAGVPPAAPPATDDHRHVDQVLVVLVAEEALAQLGQPVLSALQGAQNRGPIGEATVRDMMILDLVLRRIRSLKRCGCKIMTPRYACNLAPGCISSEPTFAGLRKKQKKENKGSQKNGSPKKREKGFPLAKLDIA